MTMLDGLGYRTWRFFAHWVCQKYLPKVCSPNKWVHWFQEKLTKDTPYSNLPDGEDIREYPPKEIAERQLSQLVERGVRMQFIYTGGVRDYYSYADQFFDMFPSLRKASGLQINYFSTLDHLAILKSDRDKLRQTVIPWIASFSQG